MSFVGDERQAAAIEDFLSCKNTVDVRESCLLTTKGDLLVFVPKSSLRGLWTQFYRALRLGKEQENKINERAKAVLDYVRGKDQPGLLHPSPLKPIDDPEKRLYDLFRDASSADKGLGRQIHERAVEAINREREKSLGMSVLIANTLPVDQEKKRSQEMPRITA